MKTLAPSQRVTIRDSKGLKFASIVEAAYNKAVLSEDEAQRINDTPGLADIIGNFIADNRMPNKFKGEEVRSNYTYPKEYKGPKPIADQIKAIAEIFNLNPAKAFENAHKLPTLESFIPADALGWTGWFAVPSVNALAKKYFPKVTDLAQKYCQAVQLVHAKIAASRSFYNHREGQITPNHLRIHTRTISALEKLKRQESEILIIAAQLGMHHCGRSTRRAREVFIANEYGLNTMMVGSIILVHPERLVRCEELDMDCSGDEFSPDADGDFSHAPVFYFLDGEAKFDAYTVGDYGDHYGSASGFLPQ